MTVFTRITAILGLGSMAAVANADTTVSGDLFKASLPGQWSEVSARPDLFVYRRAADQAEITFSTLFSKRSMSLDQQRDTLRLVIDKHRAAQLKAGPSMVLSETDLSASKLAGRFTGNDVQSHLRAATLLLSGPRGVVITYIEVFNADQPTFELQVKNIFESVRLLQ